MCPPTHPFSHPLPSVPRTKKLRLKLPGISFDYNCRRTALFTDTSSVPFGSGDHVRKEKCWVLWHQSKVIMQTYNVCTPPPPLFPTVSQLQQTLVSIQELLVQQQQKIQELSRELSAAEVTSLDRLNQM